MPFGVMSGVGRGMSVLDGVHILQGEGKFRGFLRPIGLNGVSGYIFFKNRNVFDSYVKS